MSTIQQISGALHEVKPKNARSARALKEREAKQTENPKTTLFLRYTSCSQICQLVMADLYSLKRPLAQRFVKKNDIHPFEDASSLEFFSQKNDVSLMVFGSNSKKRPHALTFVRMFEHKTLDMLELLIDPESMRTMSQFKNQKKAQVGLKPLLNFSGTLFDSPVSNAYTLAKSVLTDVFKGSDVGSVDVEGLQYIICFSAGEETLDAISPAIHMRVYLIKTKRSGQRLPRVEIEEMGPRIDFRIGRTRDADPDLMKLAMKTPRGSEARNKKNIETDWIGNQVGRIHVGKQDFSNLQSRKMKGLKRSRDLDIDMSLDPGEAAMADVVDDVDPGNKRPKVLQ